MTNDSSGFYNNMSIMPFRDKEIVMVRADVINNSIDRLMFIIGQKGLDVSVRYDPLREQNNFTVCVGNSRLGDTDDPRGLLKMYLGERSE